MRSSPRCSRSARGAGGHYPVKRMVDKLLGIEASIVADYPSAEATQLASVRHMAVGKHWQGRCRLACLQIFARSIRAVPAARARRALMSIRGCCFGANATSAWQCTPLSPGSTLLALVQRRSHCGPQAGCRKHSRCDLTGRSVGIHHVTSSIAGDKDDFAPPQNAASPELRQSRRLAIGEWENRDAVVEDLQGAWQGAGCSRGGR